MGHYSGTRVIGWLLQPIEERELCDRCHQKPASVELLVVHGDDEVEEQNYEYVELLCEDCLPPSTPDPILDVFVRVAEENRGDGQT